MYGLTNKAIEDMAGDRFVEDIIWERILQKARVDVDVLVSIKAYPDDITQRLDHAAREEVRISSSFYNCVGQRFQRE